MKNKNSKISVVIPNYNGKDFLDICLKSLANQTFSAEEVIVVDNNSSDGSIELLKSKFPWVKTIELDNNYGFSKAINIGISSAKGEFIFLLNNDTEVDSLCLEVLNNVLDQYLEADFFAVKMLFFNKRNIINDVGDVFSVYALAHQRGKDEVDKGQYDNREFVFGACAGAALYRKKMLNEIGGMDEDFYAYLEDVDLSFRAQISGHKCVFIPEAIVYHVDGGTSKKIKNFSRYFNIRNSLFVLVKNMPAELFFNFIFFIIIGQIRNLFMGLKHRCFAVVVKAYFNFFVYLPKIWKKRKIIQRKKNVSNSYLKSIISKKYPFCIKKSFKDFFVAKNNN